MILFSVQCRQNRIFIVQAQSLSVIGNHISNYGDGGGGGGEGGQLMELLSVRCKLFSLFRVLIDNKFRLCYTF